MRVRRARESGDSEPQSASGQLGLLFWLHVCPGGEPPWPGGGLFDLPGAQALAPPFGVPPGLAQAMLDSAIPSVTTSATAAVFDHWCIRNSPSKEHTATVATSIRGCKAFLSRSTAQHQERTSTLFISVVAKSDSGWVLILMRGLRFICRFGFLVADYVHHHELL